MSQFDPDTFMSEETTGAMDTVSLPVPEGEFSAIIDNVEVKEWTKDNKTSHSLQVTWEIIDDEVRKTLDRPKVTVRQTVWLDLNDQGKLDNGKGKNVGLGKLRAALGMNDPNRPFGLGHLKGAGPAMVKVGHRADKDNPEIKYAEVKAVGAVQ